MIQAPLPRRAALARSALLLPMLLLPARGRAAPAQIPPFPDWVGRTALLAGEGGAARLLLTRDGTGRMAVKLLLFCRAAPIHAFRLSPDGMSITYARSSVLDPSRTVEGEAHILAEERQLLWIEARRHSAVLEGFATPEAISSCG